jgi:hypothetical protein
MPSARPLPQMLIEVDLLLDYPPTGVNFGSEEFPAGWAEQVQRMGDGHGDGQGEVGGEERREERGEERGEEGEGDERGN